MKTVFAAVFALAIMASSALAQTRILTGRVVDSAGAPVIYANVELGSQVIVSDDSGRFTMIIPATRVAMAVRRIGYRMLRLDLAPGTDTSLTLVMIPVAHVLSQQVVSTDRTVRSLELRGFYRRLHERKYGTNAGHFITAEEIERRKPTRVSQMFDGLTGIRNAKVGGLGLGKFGCGSTQNILCWAPQGLGGCWMTVYYDGMRMRDVSSMRAPSSPTLIDEHVIPGEIAGIEVYTTPGKAPPEYQSLSGTCGVVLLWSK